jgi:hypothetical protein
MGRREDMTATNQSGSAKHRARSLEGRLDEKSKVPIVFGLGDIIAIEDLVVATIHQVCVEGRVVKVGKVEVDKVGKGVDGIEQFGLSSLLFLAAGE